MTNDDLLDVPAACALIGGTRPIHPTTLWRGIKAGIYPKPISITAQSKRFLRSELIEAINRRIAARETEAA